MNLLEYSCFIECMYSLCSFSAKLVVFNFKFGLNKNGIRLVAKIDHFEDFYKNGNLTQIYQLKRTLLGALNEICPLVKVLEQNQGIHMMNNP